MCQRVLTSEEKNVLLKLINEDFTHADVGKYVGVSRLCITRFLKRYRHRETVENLPRSGRPPTSRNLYVWKNRMKYGGLSA